LSDRVAPGESGGATAGSSEPQEKISAGVTGLSVFVAKIISIPTGLLFITLVIRTLTTADFGLWEVIATYLAWSLYPSGLINFWATRDVARGKAVGTTALGSSLILSVAGATVFLAISIISHGQISASLFPFLVASLLVPIGYWYNTASALLNGARPQKFGYVLVLGEFVKIGTAFVALYFLKEGLVGVIAALGAGNIAQALLSTVYVRGTFSGGLRLSQAGRWLRDSWIPGLNIAFTVLSIADTVVASLAIGTTIIAGYYQAAFVVATIVSYAFFISFALYPLLLRGAADRLVGSLLDLSLMLGIPMAIGTAVLSPQILFVFGKGYVASSVALSILAFASLANAMSSFLDSSLMGRDTSDLAGEERFHRFIRSNIFFVSAVDLGYAVCYVTSVFLVVWLGSRSSVGLESLVNAWAGIQLAFTAVIIVIKLRRLGPDSLRGIGRRLILYSGLALIMGAALLIASPYVITSSVDTLAYGMRLLLMIGVGAILYFGVLYAIDGRSRANLRKVLKITLRRRQGSAGEGWRGSGPNYERMENL